MDELVVIPFDRASPDQTPAGVHRPRPGRAPAGDARVGGRELPFRAPRGGRPRDARRRRPLRDAVVPLVEVDGEIVSSSHIRGLVLAGEVELAAALLGAPFRMRGEVSTANSVAARSASRPPISCPTRRSSTRTRHLRRPHRERRCAAVSIGVRPTFGTGRAVLVEAYLLDRDEDLYAASGARLLARLRGERRSRRRS